MIVLSIEEVLSRINKEQNLKLDAASEISNLAAASEGGRRIQVLKPRHSSVAALLQSQQSSANASNLINADATAAASSSISSSGEQHRSNSMPSIKVASSSSSSSRHRVSDDKQVVQTTNKEASSLNSITQAHHQTTASQENNHNATTTADNDDDEVDNFYDAEVDNQRQILESLNSEQQPTTGKLGISGSSNALLLNTSGKTDDCDTLASDEQMKIASPVFPSIVELSSSSSSAAALRSTSVCVPSKRAMFPDEDEVSVVIITGCCSKIGCSMAVGFAKLGLRVALVDFDGSQISRVAQQCEQMSPKKTRRALQIVADISQLDQAHRVIDRTIQEFGRLDVLVNIVNNGGLVEASKKMAECNGASANHKAASTDDNPHVFEQYHKIIATNMHAVTYLCISAAPYLRKTKGSILNVSQVTQNESGSSYKFAYCMSKAGIATLTKCLATDLAPDIKVICANPRSE